jgi:hypothetical protein
MIMSEINKKERRYWNFRFLAAVLLLLIQIFIFIWLTNFFS